jgi:hypothetical protein
MFHELKIRHRMENCLRCEKENPRPTPHFSFHLPCYLFIKQCSYNLFYLS